MSQEDVTKLPRWAQRRIEKAETRVTRLLTMLEGRSAVGGDTFVNHLLDQTLEPLGSEALIRFLGDPQRPGDSYYEARMDDGRLRIIATAPVVLSFTFSNVFHVGLDR